MSGILRSAIARASRLSKSSVRNYGGGKSEVMELTGRPPKLYVGVEKAEKLPAWEKGVAFAIMMVGSLAYPSWVLYYIPYYKNKGAGDEA